MIMEDHILRIIAGDNNVLAFTATTRETVGRAAAIHQTAPVVTAALGRLLTAASIMGQLLKNENDKLTISVVGDGPIGGLLATADSYSRVKGYVYHNNVDIPLRDNNKLNVSGAIGKGNLHITMDMGLKEPYSGTVPLVSGEIAEDLAYYFATSEQTPSAVGLGVLIDTDLSVKQSGGFLIRLLPGADESIIVKLEKTLSAVSSVTDLFERGMDPIGLADFIFKDVGYVVKEKIPVCYACDCSLTRVEKALIALGRDELEKILHEDKKINMHCHFCRRDYFFDEAGLNTVIRSIRT